MAASDAFLCVELPRGLPAFRRFCRDAAQTRHEETPYPHGSTAAYTRTNLLSTRDLSSNDSRQWGSPGRTPWTQVAARVCGDVDVAFLIDLSSVWGSAPR